MRWSIARACEVYVAVLLTLVGATYSGPERWWWSGANMYLPQWIWAVPALILIPLAAWKAPRHVWLPVAGIALVAGPLMGFEWAFANDQAGGRRLRVMTYNVQFWATRNRQAIKSEIAHAAPDILCLQDARGAADPKLGLLKGWHVAAYGQYVIASRFPIDGYVAGNISYRGESHSYLRATVNVDGTLVTVATAHLLTSRDALSAFRSPRRWSDGIGMIRTNFEDRLTQARRLAEDLRGVAGPVIVAGDFNVPATSVVFETLSSVATDAFAAGGRGYGYTFGHLFRVGHSFVRIDHILTSDHFAALHAFTGGAAGSDHRPVIADVVLRDR